MGRLAVLLVVAVVACDKGKKQDAPAGVKAPVEVKAPAEVQPPDHGCKTQADCELRAIEPCNPCSDCSAHHVNEPEKICAGEMMTVGCAVAPCVFIIADCVDGACVKLPKPSRD